MINETLEADREYQKAIAEAKRQAIKSSDCIDRQAAIKVVEIPVVMTGMRGGNSGTVNAVNAFKSIVIDGLRALPPTEPKQERKAQYKHFKGDIYDLICNDVKHTETGETLVVYRDVRGQMWARPESEFYGLVAVNGEFMPRFMLYHAPEEEK